MARSRYLEQLDRYEALFPQRQLLVLKSEDLFTNTERLGKDPSLPPAASDPAACIATRQCRQR